jgi:O-antigen ligase
VRGLVAIGYQSARVPRRIELLKERLETITAHPITGVGIGQIKTYSIETEADTVHGAHFTPLEIIAETGVLGLMAVIIIILVYLRFLQENTAFALSRDSGWLQLSEGLVIALIGILVYGLTHDVQTNRTMWLILALIVGFKRAYLAQTMPAGSGHQVNDGIILPVNGVNG